MQGLVSGEFVSAFEKTITVRDATAAYTREAMHAAMNIDGPTYAHEILPTAELVAAIKKG